MEIVALTLDGHMPHYDFAIILVQKKGDWILGYWGKISRL